MASIQICVFVLFCGNLMVAAYPDNITEKYDVQITDILNNFDILMNLDLSENNFHSKLMRKKDRIPEVCVLSIDGLNEITAAATIIEHFDDFLQNKNLVSNAITVNFFPNCTKMDKLKSGILRLKFAFRLIVYNKISSVQYHKDKDVYFNQLSILENDLFYITKTAPVKNIEILSNLETALKFLQRKIQMFLETLESEQRMINDDNFRSVISFLGNHDSQNALVIADKMNNFATELEKIVLTAYGNNEENFDSILIFVQKLLSKDQSNGYRALFNGLGKDSNSSNIWILTQIVMLDYRFGIRDLRTLLFNEVVERVQNNNLDRVIADINKNNETLRNISYALVSAFYAEGNGSIIKAVDFMSKLTRLSDRYHFLKKLINLLKSKGKLIGTEMTIIVYELIKIRKENKRTKSRLNFTRKALEKLLPNGMRELMYNKICIQNIKNGEFLHVARTEVEARRYIYTSKKRDQDGSFLWNIQFTKKGTRVLIQNCMFGEYIILYDDSFAPSGNKTAWFWFLSPTLLFGDQRGEFSLYIGSKEETLIINDIYEHVLYSPGETFLDGKKDIRKVYSEKYNAANVSSHSKWRIGLCRIPFAYEFTELTIVYDTLNITNIQ